VISDAILEYDRLAVHFAVHFAVHCGFPACMFPSRQIRATLFYSICVTTLVGFVLAIKAGAAVVTDRFLYSIPILGGVLRTLELVELLNIIIFAVLGMGIGIAARILRPPVRLRVSQIVLGVLMPLVFLSGSLFEYQIWLNHVANVNKISNQEAQTLTDRWLKQTVNQEGFWGFYRFTAHYTLLPQRTEELSQTIGGAERVDAAFAQITDRSPEEINRWLIMTTWGLRLFYFVLAVLSGITHFREGFVQIPKRSRQPQ
jgi:hypothetical protein